MKNFPLLYNETEVQVAQNGFPVVYSVMVDRNKMIIHVLDNVRKDISTCSVTNAASDYFVEKVFDNGNLVGTLSDYKWTDFRYFLYDTIGGVAEWVNSNFKHIAYDNYLMPKDFLNEAKKRAGAGLCPSCKDNYLNPNDVMNGLSRKDNKTLICNDCETSEAFADFR